MKNRLSALIVCGLSIIILMFLFYYMSCQAKSAELENTSSQLGDRIRLLNIKNVGYEKTIEAILINKRILETQKSNLKIEMGNKSLEITDLNHRLSKNFDALQRVRADNKILEQQLKKLKDLSEKLISKNSALREAYKGLLDRKKSKEKQLRVALKKLNYFKQKLGLSEANFTISSTRTSTTTTTTTTEISTLLATTDSSFEVLPNADGVDQGEEEDVEDQNNLFKILNDLLHVNVAKLDVNNTPMTTTRTTVLPLNEKKFIDDKHMHIEDEHMHIEHELEEAEISQNTRKNNIL